MPWALGSVQSHIPPCAAWRYPSEEHHKGQNTPQHSKPNSARPVSAEGGSGRCQRQAGAGALFQEIASRLPPAGGGAAGYTDVYDFPEGALEVADGFLRDAPASEQPGSNAAAEAAAIAQEHTAVPLAAAGRGLSQQGVGLERQPSGALQPDRTDFQHEAASHSAAPAAAAPAPVTAVQETEQRSCRSSVTPHKAGMRDADAGGDQHGVDSRSNHKGVQTWQRQPARRHAGRCGHRQQLQPGCP